MPDNKDLLNRLNAGEGLVERKGAPVMPSDKSLLERLNAGEGLIEKREPDNTPERNVNQPQQVESILPVTDIPPATDQEVKIPFNPTQFVTQDMGKIINALPSSARDVLGVTGIVTTDFLNNVVKSEGGLEELKKYTKIKSGIIKVQKDNELSELNSQYPAKYRKPDEFDKNGETYRDDESGYQQAVKDINSKYNAEKRQTDQATFALASQKVINDKLKQGIDISKISPGEIGADIERTVGDEDAVDRGLRIASKYGKMDPTQKVNLELRGYQAMDAAKETAIANGDEKTANYLSGITKDYTEKIRENNPEFVKHQKIAAIREKIAHDNSSLWGSFFGVNINDDKIKETARSLGWSDKDIEGITAKDVDDLSGAPFQTISSYISNTSAPAAEFAFKHLGIQDALLKAGLIDKDKADELFSNEWYDQSPVGKVLNSTQPNSRNIIEAQNQVEANPNKSDFLFNVSNDNAGKFNVTGGTIGNAMWNGLGQVLAFSQGAEGVGSALKGIGVINNANKAREVGFAVSNYITGYDRNYRSAQQDIPGNDEDSEMKRAALANFRTGVDIATEKIFPDYEITDMFKTSTGKELIHQITTKGLDALDKTAVTEGVKKMVKESLSGVAKEGLEESAGVAANMVGDMLFAPPDKFNDTNYKRDALQQGVLGALSSVLPVVGGNMVQYRNHGPMTKSLLYDVGQNPDSYKQSFEEDIANGKISHEEGNKKIQTVNTLSNIVKNSVPESSIINNQELTQKQKEDYTDLRLQESLLNAKKEQVQDPVQEKFIDEQLNDIQIKKEDILVNAGQLEGDELTNSVKEFISSRLNQQQHGKIKFNETEKTIEAQGNEGRQDVLNETPQVGSSGQVTIGTSTTVPSVNDFEEEEGDIATTESNVGNNDIELAKNDKRSWSNGQINVLAFDIKNSDKNIGQIVVNKTDEGYKIGNIIIDDEHQRKGYGKTAYRDLNKQSIEETGKPLFSDKYMTMPDGTQANGRVKAAENLWDYFVNNGEATKVNDRYAFKNTVTEYKPEDFTNHSGGAAGSDTVWDKIGREFGVNNHTHYTSPGQSTLDSEDLNSSGAKAVMASENDYKEGAIKAEQAAKDLGRIIPESDRHFVYRDWKQVSQADAIYAIGTIAQKGEVSSRGYTAKIPQVEGGTGYGVQMAINEGKPTFVFDQEKDKWFKAVYKETDSGEKEFIGFEETDTPVLNKNFSGIGVIKINDKGVKAIKDVYNKTFGSRSDILNKEIIPEEDYIRISELIDKPVIYKGERANLYLDGQTVVAKILNHNREYEIGNVSEISSMPIKDLGIEQESSVVTTDDNDNIVVRGTSYRNLYSDPFAAINRDIYGNLVSVTLDTEDGQKRTFRGQIAEDVAYQLVLQQINKNNEHQQQELEDFINGDEATRREIEDTRSSVAAERESSSGTPEVLRKPAKVQDAVIEVPNQQAEKIFTDIQNTPLNATQESIQQQKISPRGNLIEHQGVEEGQSENRVSQGTEREAPQSEANNSDINTGSEGQVGRSASERPAISDPIDQKKNYVFDKLKNWKVAVKDKMIVQDVKDTYEKRTGDNLLDEDYVRAQSDKIATDLSMDAIVEEANAILGNETLPTLLSAIIDDNELHLETKQALSQALLRQPFPADVINNIRKVDKDLARRASDTFMIRRGIRSEAELTDEQQQQVASALGEDGVTIENAKQVLDDSFGDNGIPNVIQDKVAESDDTQTALSINKDIEKLQEQDKPTSEKKRKTAPLDTKMFSSKRELLATQLKSSVGNNFMTDIVNKINEIAKKC